MKFSVIAWPEANTAAALHSLFPFEVLKLARPNVFWRPSTLTGAADTQHQDQSADFCFEWILLIPMKSLFARDRAATGEVEFCTREPCDVSGVDGTIADETSGTFIGIGEVEFCKMRRVWCRYLLLDRNRYRRNIQYIFLCKKK